MNIDILTTDGSPIGICPECVYGDENRVGVGGSELFLFTLCEAWREQGHIVRLYNNPHKQVDWQFPTNAFEPNENRDVLINFRTPNKKSLYAKGLKVWLSCDQYSQGSYKHFAPYMDKIVCISQCHVDFFKLHYGIENAIYIDIPIREKDFTDSEKIRNRLIFTSIPDRGLTNLLRIYPDLLREIPDVSLVITSDYKLWGVSAQNEKYRMDWIKYMGSVQFRGALPRRKYIEELCKADLMVYPCLYQELFCISVAEAQWAGVYPITSTAGALETTNMGTLINGDSDKLYIDVTVELCNNRYMLEKSQSLVKSKARQRFSLERILTEWQMKIFN